METWAALELRILIGLTLVIVAAGLAAWRGRSNAAATVAGGAFGAAFFVWVGGIRAIAPTEVGWTMRLDWQWHFLGWHFFRHEPWHLPPGRIDGYFTPLGTAIGFTDAIPLAAFVFKPFASALPMPFQYLGLWLLLCFVLQGAFGVWLVRLWSRDTTAQILGGALFVLVPTLVGRVGHAALSSHWLLLWALWIYVRADRDPAHAPWTHAAAIGAIAGLVHPYLAVMALVMFGATALRLMVDVRALGVPRLARLLAAIVVLPTLLVVAGWWASGLFTVRDIRDLAAEGLSRYSMNVLAIVTPSGSSSLLPELPSIDEVQAFEGFQYLGVGLLALIVVAGIVRLRRGGTDIRTLWPLAVVCAVMAIYALSPRVTFGAQVIADVHLPWLERVSMFRATGRFFWPAAYLLMVLALATLASRLRASTFAALMAVFVALQAVDLHPRHAALRAGHLDPALYTWPQPLTSGIWEVALPHYDHVVLYPPPHCAPPPTSFEGAAYLAGLHGLTINDALVARFSVGSMHRACQALARAMQAGDVDGRTLYLMSPADADALRAVARQPVACGVVDGVAICVTDESYRAWRDRARLE